jgi:hypothetical protein
MRQNTLPPILKIFVGCQFCKCKGSPYGVIFDDSLLKKFQLIYFWDAVILFGINVLRKIGNYL